MKLKVILLLSMLSSTALAGPYAEYTHEFELKDWVKSHAEATDMMRFGWETENNLYFEIGPMTHGHSYEAGYQFTFDDITMKGAIETEDTNGGSKTKVETVIRFNF